MIQCPLERISLCFSDECSTHTEDMIVTDPPGKISSPKELLRWVWKQLNRDIATFLPTNGPQPRETAPAQLEGRPAVRPSASVDHAQLTKLQSRRAILDWRDGFHIRATQRAQVLRDTFVDEINERLDGVGVVRRIFAKHASDVLQDLFIRTVRVPLFQYLTEEEHRLHSVLRNISARRQFGYIFEKDWSASECANLRDIRFKPANREKLRLEADSLILGESGLIRPFLVQADRIAQVLINEELGS